MVREPGDLFRPLRRRWRWVVAGLVAGVLGGALVSVLIPVRYSATTSVLVTPTGGATSANDVNGRTKDEINLDTEAQLVKSAGVADLARRRFAPNQSAAAIARRVSVAVPANTTVLRISYRASSRRQARDGANALAAAYLANRAATAQIVLNRQATAISREIASVEATRLKARRSGATGVVNYAAQIASLSGRLTSVETTVVTPGRIITRAGLPGSRSGPGALLLLLSGAMLGGLLGVLAAVVRERTDPRLRHPERLVESGIPVLLSVPGEDDEVAERAYGDLRNIVFSTCGTSMGAVLVAAVSPDQSDAEVARHLAVALARFGRRVGVLRATDGTATLVEADARGGVRTRAAVLAGDEQKGDSLGGGLPGALAKLRRSADFVVVDAAPIASEPLTPALAASCNGAVLVVQLGVTRIAAVSTAISQLELMHGKVLGAVVMPPARGRRRRSTAAAERAAIRTRVETGLGSS
jgi:capsular polysaccharide biosynthesis protein